MFNERIRPVTLFSFFPRNKRLKLNKDGLNQIKTNHSKVNTKIYKNIKINNRKIIMIHYQ
jgi:hypothetical protein